MFELCDEGYGTVESYRSRLENIRMITKGQAGRKTDINSTTAEIRPTVDNSRNIFSKETAIFGAKTPKH